MNSNKHKTSASERSFFVLWEQLKETTLEHFFLFEAGSNPPFQAKISRKSLLYFTIIFENFLRKVNANCWLKTTYTDYWIDWSQRWKN